MFLANTLYISYCNKYLAQYYDNYESIQPGPEKLAKDEITDEQKAFMRDYRRYMRDYRSSPVKMTDKYLSTYLKYGPRRHFYTLTEHRTR